MSVTTVVEKRFISTDGKSILISYDSSDNSKVEMKITINGQDFPFSTVQDFRDFMDDMVGAIDLVHSVSGSGAGYVPATAGTDGNDPIID
jgi:hypothetical protein